ncbi:hypothetical protein EVAR_89076_1 [Eumeta japonica]|uniref:Uncharacterized protein n=1 Tax=Eumeta variegata TaxID=151549 RepID=A0A4C1SBW9_EUMVA|nr:hypothetical protein EVAR_89076_1 [Eumeta japonica]
MMIKQGLDSEWSEWKTIFCTYTNKGWNTSKYALSFKYQSGSLLDYAVKKRLLLEINKRYLHLLSDHFTRYAYVLTSSTQNANDFIKLIRNCAETDDIELILSDQYPVAEPGGRAQQRRCRYAAPAATLGDEMGRRIAEAGCRVQNESLGEIPKLA